MNRLLAGDEGKGGSGVRGYLIATAAWMRLSASKPDSTISNRDREKDNVSVTFNVEAADVPAAQIAQKRFIPPSPRTTLRAVHNDGTGSKYVSKTRVTRQNVELRSRTNASFLWGFEKWENCLALDVAKSREAGDIVLEGTATVLLVAIVLVVQLQNHRKP